MSQPSEEVRHVRSGDVGIGVFDVRAGSVRWLLRERAGALSDYRQESGRVLGIAFRGADRIP